MVLKFLKERFVETSGSNVFFLFEHCFYADYVLRSLLD